MLTKDTKLQDYRLPESRKGRSRGPADGSQNQQDYRSHVGAFANMEALGSMGFRLQGDISQKCEALLDTVICTRYRQLRWMKGQTIPFFILQQQLITNIYSH